MRRPVLFGAAVGAIVVILGAHRAVSVMRDPLGTPPPQGFEALRRGSAYGTSQRCAPCHAGHVASWRRTFHRTMTQDPTAAAIEAPFDGRVIDLPGLAAKVRRDQRGSYIDMPAPGSGAVVAHRVDRVTGSRRMQQFETREGDRFVRLPLAWSIAENRWFHLSEAFFHPDGEDVQAYRAVWDLNCIFCHTTRPVPGLDASNRLASTTAELGIACEACHGPGDEHARRMRAPDRRYALRWAGAAEPTIVNPERLDKARSVAVCGHCHGQRLPADREAIRTIMAEGDPYVPGDDLSRWFVPVTRDTKIGSFSFASRFWGDGSPRLTAYEYQGLLDSECHRRGSMTCLSCHTMHAGDPHGQLRPDLPGDALCTQCHDTYTAARRVEHTHHRDESTGSRCVSCHMPEVVYGVMTWHPTHRIANPDPASAHAVGMPDACTLCHAGRSASWAASAIARFWPGHARKTPPPDPVPELPRALFAGDPIYRALAAERLGLLAPEAEVRDRAIPLLAEALLDDYPNVRRIARASLVKLTGASDLPLALAPREERDGARLRLQAAHRPGAQDGWPFSADGTLDRRILEEWKDERDDAPIAIGE